VSGPVARHGARRAIGLLGAELVAGALVTGCASAEPPPERWVEIDVSPELTLRAADLSVTPDVARHIEATPTGFAVRLRDDVPGPVTVTAPGACTAVIDRAAPPARAALVPWMTLPRHVNDAGFGATVTLVARPGCDAARATPITWSTPPSHPPAPMQPSANSHEVRVTLPDLPAALREAPWGLVPLSPRTRGEVTLEASYRDGQGTARRARVTVAATPRATGVPSVAVSQRVWLGGAGWQVTDAPPEGHAAVAESAQGASLVPDAPGVWRLRDAGGRVLSLTAGHLGRTPLDCTRADCHAALARAPLTRMTTVLQRGLTGALGPDYDPMCAVACHATGEPGIDDGGLLPTLAGLGRALPRGDRAWEHLPRPLRRLGGVGCVACHGTAALPEPDARWSILRSDVCATCHDGPPEYAHVLAYAESRMSRADASPASRHADSDCIRCHTTSGFLTHLGVLEGYRPVPEGVGPIGIGCAACHAAHAHPGDAAVATPSLLRDPEPPGWLDAPATSVARSEPRTRVCLPCHAPRPEALDASASAAALWAGQGGLDPQSGEPLDGPSPHGVIDGGCVGCHRGGPEVPGRGREHAFRASTGICSGCHTERAADTSIRTRALELLRTAGGGAPEMPSPLHAKPGTPPKDATLARALYNLRLVVEDGAAAVHNAAYARELVAAAERVLRPTQRGGP
jgi:hypothetical protein